MQSIRLLNNPADEFSRAQAKLVLARLGGKEVLQALATEEINENSDFDCTDVMCAIEDKMSQQEFAVEEEKRDRVRAARHYKKEQALAKIKAHEEEKLIAVEEKIADLESEATEGRRKLARQEARCGGGGSPEDFLSTMLINQTRQEIIKIKASSNTAEQALKKANDLLQESRTKCETIFAKIESAFEEGAQGQAAGHSAEEEMACALTIKLQKEHLASEEKYAARAQRYVDSMTVQYQACQRKLLEHHEVIEENQRQQKFSRMSVIEEHAVQMGDEDNHEQRLAMLQEASSRLKEKQLAKEQASAVILPTLEDPACDSIIAKMRERAEEIRKNASGNRHGK